MPGIQNARCVHLMCRQGTALCCSMLLLSLNIGLMIRTAESKWSNQLDKVPQCRIYGEACKDGLSIGRMGENVWLPYHLGTQCRSLPSAKRQQYKITITLFWRCRANTQPWTWEFARSLVQNPVAARRRLRSQKPKPLSIVSLLHDLTHQFSLNQSSPCTSFLEEASFGGPREAPVLRQSPRQSQSES